MNFGQKFTYCFYENLLPIINDSSKLEEAVIAFQDSNVHSDKSRYLCKEKFGLQEWSDDSAAKFSAAIAEALRLTTLQFQHNDLKEIQAVSNNIQTNVVPSLAERASKVAALDPFSTLSGVINSSLGDLRGNKYNRYQLFAIGAAVVGALVVTGAIALGAYQSK